MQGRQLLSSTAPIRQPTRLRLGFGMVAAFVVCIVDLMNNYGADGLVIGGIIAFAVVYNVPHLLNYILSILPSDQQVQKVAPAPAPALAQKTRVLADPVKESVKDTEALPDTVIVPEEMDWFPPRKRAGLFTFSEVLRDFIPKLESIYLAEQMDGSWVTVSAKQLCHVALAGATWGGKSNCIRLLMAQLCRAGLPVLLLNPHYTRYDLEHKEDWTPYEPYLLCDPMESRSYEIIEHYLRYIAEELLPKRLEKYAHSQPLGRPYFIILDELPAIVEHVKQAPKYLEILLREGRKVGLFVISGSQDYLVKTIAPQGGGAVRNCYLTTIYTGGDATTAKVLLDLPPNQIQEDKLGQGMVMVRTFLVKQAIMARVPYMDNAALYHLLGPSTFVPSIVDEVVEEDLPVPTVAVQKERVQVTGHVPTRQLTTDLQMAFNEYESGMTYRALGKKLHIGKDKAGEMIKELKERRLIG